MCCFHFLHIQKRKSELILVDSRQNDDKVYKNSPILTKLKDEAI